MFVPLKVFLFCIILASLIASDVNVPVSVIRRIRGDIFYYVTSTNHFVCNDNNVTFLVSENRCIKNEELLNGNHVSLNHRLMAIIIL